MVGATCAILTKTIFISQLNMNMEGPLLQQEVHLDETVLEVLPLVDITSNHSTGTCTVTTTTSTVLWLSLAFLAESLSYAWMDLLNLVDDQHPTRTSSL
jgi:hypothetical protein